VVTLLRAATNSKIFKTLFGKMLRSVLLYTNIDMDEIVIRDAVEADLPVILDIYNDVVVNTTAVYSEKPHTLQMRADWYLDRVNNGFPVYVAELNGDITGFCSFGHFRAWPCYRYTAELSLYVAENYRGRGISKIMLQALIDRAQEMNIHALLAGVSADNQISVNLHRSFGFGEVAHFKEVGYKFGRWLDLKFLELLLNSAPGPI
jgi:L-amino acid N-acyltransferase YncA